MLKGAILTWTPKAYRAFQQTKDRIDAATTTAFLSLLEPLALHTDALDTSVGATLNQLCSDGTWVPLGFFSRKLSDTEIKYSVYDRGLLAIHSAINHFHRILEGRPFTTYSDHKPLSFALLQQSDK